MILDDDIRVKEIWRRNSVHFSLITIHTEPRLARAAGPMGRWAGAPGRSVLFSLAVDVFIVELGVGYLLAAVEAGVT